MNRIGHRALALALLLAVLAAGAPLLAAQCRAMGPRCPMMTEGVGHAACATGARFAPAFSCCATEAVPAPAPTGAAAVDPPATAPVSGATNAGAAAVGPRLSTPAVSAADRARAERRHALGLFTLHAALLN